MTTTDLWFFLLETVVVAWLVLADGLRRFMGTIWPAFFFGPAALDMTRNSLRVLLSVIWLCSLAQLIFRYLAG